MSKALHILTALILTLVADAYAQNGGGHVYAFLDLSPSASYAAVGGAAPSTYIPGPNSALMNPALPDSLSHQSAAINMVQYVADARYGSALYSHSIRHLQITGGAMMLNYGNMDLTDEAANVLGTFSCRDAMVFASASRQLRTNIRAGVSAKYITSKLESYHSQGLAMDIGLMLALPSQKMDVGLAVRNAGFQITTYSHTREHLPLDIQLGISKILLHAPIRLMLTAHSLQHPKLAGSFGESLANHFNIAAELFPEGVVSLKGGFSFQRHNELRVSGGSPFPGFSMGLDVRLKRFSLQYSRQCISPAASANMITAEVFIGKFLVR